jgi:hypothetical protein
VPPSTAFGVHSLGDAHTHDLVCEPRNLVNSLGLQPTICADLAMVGDGEVITIDRDNTIVVHHPPRMLTVSLHSMRVPSSRVLMACRASLAECYGDANSASRRAMR